MNVLIFILSVLFFVLIFCAITIIFDISGREKVNKRLYNLVSNQEIDDVHDEVIKEKRRNKRKGFILISSKLENSLAMSGIKLSATEYIYAWIGCTIIPILVLGILGQSFITLIGVGVVGLVLPPLIVENAKKKKQILFNKQLGESLIVMSNCLKSGYSFQQAMESIATDMQPPISTEFSRTLREISYGVNLETALNHMLARVQNKDLDLLVSAVLTSTQVGANLSEILDTISETIKDRINIRNEIRVLTAQGRFSGLVIGLLPIIVSLLLMIINPEYINSFFESEFGGVMIVVGVVMECIGFIIVKKIVEIKY